MGRPVDDMTVAGYHAYQAEVWPVVTAALDRLRAASDLVVVEGAGSSAEINLRDQRHRQHARGAARPGARAAGRRHRPGRRLRLAGRHMELFTPAERALVRGFIINKFRGDAALLDPGLAFLEERTGVPTLGVVPFLGDWRGDEEDSLAIDDQRRRRPGAPLRIAVVRLPFISNYTDFDALADDPDVDVELRHHAGGAARRRRRHLPGTKSTVADLAWLRERGLAAALAQAAAAGTPVIGICGGYQMLGRRILDPERVESAAAEVAGLGLLDVETTFLAAKRTVRVTGEASGAAFAAAGTPLHGYEIHMGRTRRAPGIAPLVHVTVDGSGEDPHADGAVSADGLVCGTYLHGLFDAAAFREAFLGRLRAAAGLPERAPGASGAGPSDIERLADHVEAHLDMARLDAIVGL